MINIVVNPIFINLNYNITVYIICNLTTIVNNYSKPVLQFSLITLINLTCLIKPKIYISWNKTLFGYGIRVIHPCIAKETDLSRSLVNRYRLVKYRECCIHMDSILIRTKVLLYSKQFYGSFYLGNTFWSCIQIGTEYIERTRESSRSVFTSAIQTELLLWITEFYSELYLKRYRLSYYCGSQSSTMSCILKDTDWV